MNDNEIIADFMGEKLVEEGQEYTPPFEKFTRKRTFDYHKSYDALMPAYHKFNKLYNTQWWADLSLKDQDKFQELNEDIDSCLTRSYTVKLVRDALAIGIKWYNAQKK